MTYDLDNGQQSAPKTLRRGRRIRVSAMRLLAVGALCAAPQAWGQAVTNPAEFQAALDATDAINNNDIFITGGDLDLGGMSFTLGPAAGSGQLLNDGTIRTISNGTLTVTSGGPTNRTILVLDPEIIWQGDIVLGAFSDIDIDGPTAFGSNATLVAADTAVIRLFTGAGTVTHDADFFNGITGVADQTTIAFTANGESMLTALPTFDAVIALDIYDDFEFDVAPLVNPLVTLGDNLAGNHAVIVNVGTLNLNDFNFTIDSLTGEMGSAITLGTGTLTTGDETDTTYAGVISGTGDLTKTGTGAFTLSGVNTYTGTTTVALGTLVLEADQTGHTAVIVQNGGILQVNQDQTGAPVYTIENGGIVNFDADVADTTAVTIDAGGLLDLRSRSQTLASIAGGGDIDLGIAATLTVGDATSTTFSGSISGTTSNLTKVGAGNLTLSGTNTYNGATTLSEGTLTVDGALTGTSSVTLATGTTLTLNGDINNGTPVIIAGGATLDLNGNNETLGSVTGTGDITLGSATLTIDNNSSFTFDGTISEAGDLTKAGAGTLTLSGQQNYTGATNINGGTLIALGDLATSGVTVGDGATFNLEGTITDANADVTVNDGGTLFGSGTIGDDLINNGTVTFLGQGAGDILTVNGNYTQGASGILNVQLGNADGLVVMGTANLGGTLNITTPADPANFDINATYNVIDANSTSGNFATTTDDFVFLDLNTNNVGGNVQVTLARNATAISSITQSATQTSIANILDSVGPTGELNSALDRILASSESGALSTLDQLGGTAAATVSTEVAASVTVQNHRLLDQIVGVQPGTSRPLGAFGPAAGPIEFDDTDHITLLSFAQDSPEEAGDNTALDFTPWASIYGGFGDEGDGATGLDYTRYGLVAGLDLAADESDARYGISLGIEQTEFDLNNNTGDIDIDSIYLAGYVSQPLGAGFKFTILGSLGYHNHESDRTILIGATPTQARADFDSFSFSFAGEISKAFNFEHVPSDPGSHPTVTTLEPFVRLDYSLSSQDGYSETGAGTAGLNVSSEDFDSSRIAGGLRVEHQYMLFNQREATLRGSALASFALTNPDSTLSASFVNTPGSNFEIVGADQDDVFGQVGIGLSVEINDNWDIHFDIDHQFSDSSNGTFLAGVLSYEF